MNLYYMESFRKKCELLGISLSEEQTGKFLNYYRLLTEWNSFMNLTAITEPDEVILKHFVDSLAIFQVKSFREYSEVYEEKDAISLIDVGTGAGFPGIPLKIVFPWLRVVLLDSLKKRVIFLDKVINELNLKNIEAVHGRAEDFARKKEYREQFDFCVSRAVANISTLSELCIPFVKKGGYFVSYKSEKGKEELAAGKNVISILGGELENHLEYILPESDIKRDLFVIKKVEKTLEKYPRKAGIPEKKPLK